ncbi:type II toxin-antitoxin system RelE/ParE family toxin [Zunongwangia endophytica]|uniref:Type II toxin-antitoxin system RelE/ParE family toxin n=1 Tax=Zunongwangia endophytica TaxID=1808945 RepID=A0ABV8H7Y2_9FLAO|nr:type II toxin-antitoxin system RelE/ParE family toxin [Zunongwangia endophytica]MDN3596128.1 type II toxin-antitoxin system RelE/ParE family toxin [Zunongwangia endophytica]
MVEIIWSDFAINSLKEIYDYYKSNVHLRIAKKIKSEILQTTNQLKTSPELGQIEFYLEELNRSHRYIISGNYKIIYRIKGNQVLINDVFDVRRNPDKMLD